MTPLHPDLTTREEQVVDLHSSGLSREQIADRLGISAHTVKAHLDAARKVYDAPNLATLAARHERRRRRVTRSRQRRALGQLEWMA